MMQTMRHLIETKAFLASLLVMFLLLFASCHGPAKPGYLVLTQVKSDSGKALSLERFFEGQGIASRIVAFDPGNRGAAPLVLTSEFFAAMSPEISYDGKYMLFAGKRLENDPWRIWEMDLSSKDITPVSPEDAVCIDPAYLPGDQVVYSIYVPEEITPGHYALERSNRKGGERQRITFSPDDYRASSVLLDGRILVRSKQIYPQVQDPVWKALRPDGTKEELFYASGNSDLLSYRARETAEGRICFLERESTSGSLNIASVSYNMPHTSFESESFGRNGDFVTAITLETGKVIVAHRKDSEDRFGLFIWNPDEGEADEVAWKDPGYDVLQAAVIRPRQRPKKLPSAVDPEESTALLMCQDVNLAASGVSDAVQLEVIGIQGSLGVVGLERDGSIYLRVKADTPFQLQALDAQGRVVNGPSSWITMRPSERRGCVGCHAGHDMVPENRQPLSVQKEPLDIPRVINNSLAKNNE